GDRKVDAPRGHLLDRRGRVGWLANRNVEAGLLEVAPGLRGVDAGVVGVREVVEHQLDVLGARGLEHVVLLAAAGEHESSRARERGQPSHTGVSCGFHGQARRSTRATRANSETAMTVSRTIPA